MASLTFLGAAQEVTGSCYLLETLDGVKVLLECGMRQGRREADNGNRAPFPFDPASIDAVVISHAHLDHSGLLPRLAAEGFKGPIFATEATCELLELMLLDSRTSRKRTPSGRTAGATGSASRASSRCIPRPTPNARSSCAGRSASAARWRSLVACG